ncbi:polysaccharide pyruvyl transferase family protein [Flavobacterium piscis]|uniref:Pyruvyl transferase n=1 Tax=Flavobacterium piscis TaxID=1114874 RepID=A0ABU1YB47_9FLAO|nr:polysaccharide pyruvyl transferase family protein [Flavobacterium piscis]MDR7210676.1 pyruvyl transferase [Flavobacterium piscis]
MNFIKLYFFFKDSLKKKYHRQKWLMYNYGDTNRRIKRKRVNVYYFKRAGGVDNVGDLLSLVVVDFIKKRNGLIDKPLNKTVRLFAIGSIMDLASSDMVVWGSGLRNNNSSPPKVNFDIRAVRGPKTRNKLLNNGFSCPEIFGDPALLLPLFYNPDIEKKNDYIIIPHYSKELRVPQKYKNHMVSTITSDWKGFVDEILASNYVITGSLHGLIIAEAYGIPAVLLSSDIDNDLFKYEDYYHSTNRINFKVGNSLEEVLSNRIYNTPIENLKELQDNLISSFPVDLW